MVFRGNVAFSLLLFAAWLGCSRHEPVGSVASASGHVGRLDPMSPSQNTFSTVFQNGRLLAAFNNSNGSPMGWGFIDNPSPTTTIPWTLCDAAGAGPCGGVAMAPGQTACPL